MPTSGAAKYNTEFVRATRNANKPKLDRMDLRHLIGEVKHLQECLDSVNLDMMQKLRDIDGLKAEVASLQPVRQRTVEEARREIAQVAEHAAIRYSEQPADTYLLTALHKVVASTLEYFAAKWDLNPPAAPTPTENPERG